MICLKKNGLRKSIKTKRDFGYWVLRILGFSYVAYLGILIIGILEHHHTLLRSEILLQ
ncbi:MAG: hypothetical protein R3A12_19580 [Ignavibacteria bacterium]